MANKSRSKNSATKSAGIFSAVFRVVIAAVFSLIFLTCCRGAYAQSETSAGDVEELRKNVERFRPLAKKKAELADSLYQLGKALAERRNFAEAQTNLEAALALDLALDNSKSVVNDYVALALVQSYQKHYDQAQVAYIKAFAVAKKEEMIHMIVQINNDMGSNAVYAGHYDGAKTYFAEAKAAAKGSNDCVGEAQARLNLAIIEQHEGHLKEAISETEEAGTLLTGVDDKDSILAAQTALNLGQLKDQIGDLDGAAKQFQLAADSGADPQIEANAWVALGNIKLSRGQAKEAEAAFSKALEIFRAENTSAQIATVITRLGCAKADMGDFSAAEKLHLQAIQSAKDNNNNDALYAGLYESAYDYYLEGNIDRALTKFEELKKLLAGGMAVSDINASADTINAMALCYRALGQLSVARDCYLRAADIYNQKGNKLAALACQNSIACTLLDGSNVSQFKALHDTVLAAIAALPDKDKERRDCKRLTADVAYNFAQSQVVETNYDGAMASFKDALTAFRGCGDTRGQMNALIGMGLSRFSAGRESKNTALLTEAVGYFDQARKIAVSLGTTEGQWDAAIGVGSCYRTIGDNAHAEENLKLAIDLFEKEKGHFSRDDSKTYTLDLRYSAFEELVALLYDQKRFDDALATAERGRARSFLDLLEGRRRNLFGQGKLAFLTGSLPDEAAPSPKSPGATKSESIKISQAPPAGTGPGEIPGSVTRGVDVIPREGRINLETALSPINAEAPSLEQIKALVASHKTCAVEYFVAPNLLYIFVAHPDGTVSAASQAINARDLNKLVDKTYQSVISPPANLSDLKGSNERREKNLSDLYDVLIAPIKEQLPKDPAGLVTIIPHRTLFLVPFAGLIDNSKKFLVEDHTLSVVPALGVLRATEHMAGEQNIGSGASQDKLLAFGNPVIKQVAGLGPLPYAEQEVKKISSIFGDARSMVKIGAAATKATLIALAPNYNVIHLATHGLIDEEHPMESAVLLATEGGDDGVLSVRDILKLPPLKAHLVTLSACQTGRGRISGDGVAGLSRSFIIAGTPSVMVSLWNVDDVMTAFQMESFYKDYLAGQDKGTALRSAQLKTIAFMEKGLTMAGFRANPRYWAAFQLVGEAR